MDTAPAPRVSVVVSVRDGAAFLEQALESVLSQTLHELELIVVDDGSADRTPEILATFAARDSRVRVLQREGSGVTAALNQGCAAAAATYVARFDGDDVALPDRLARQVELLDAHPDVGLVGGAYFSIDAAGRRGATFKPPTGDAALRARLSRYNVFAHPAATFRRAAFEEVGGYRLAEAEDYDLWLRISERWQLASLPEPVLAYRHHASQISLVRAREYALAALAARTAATQRRAGGADLLEGVEQVTVDVLEQLGLSTAEVAQAVAEIDLRRAAMLSELGDRVAAAAVLAAIADSGSPYTVRQVRARHAFGRAVQAWRGGRQVRSALLFARAIATDPSASAAEVSAVFGRRRPGRQ
jgi:GT2 family glycosyltransferase